MKEKNPILYTVVLMIGVSILDAIVFGLAWNLVITKLLYVPYIKYGQSLILCLAGNFLFSSY